MKKNIVGIIAEYNPFHLGHLYHLRQAKAVAKSEIALIVMSGPFTQRGDAALFSPCARAEMALRQGADIVFELPTLFSLRQADAFAMGGISLLTQMGCTHVAFGAEANDMPLFEKAAELIMHPSAAFENRIKEVLLTGVSYAKAQGIALEETLSSNLLTSPNNILALCYMQALKKLNSPLQPILIKRKGAYHDVTIPEDGAYPSATALRAAILRNDWLHTQSMTDRETFSIILREMELGRIHRPDSLDQALRFMLNRATTLSQYPGVTEGIDMLIKKHANNAISKEALLAAIKSKRYTYTRLNRLLAHIALDITPDCFEVVPHYARFLGARSEALSAMRQLKKNGFPIIEKAAEYDSSDRSFQIDMRAYDLWALGANLPFGEGYRQSPVVLK